VKFDRALLLCSRRLRGWKGHWVRGEVCCVGGGSFIRLVPMAYLDKGLRDKAGVLMEESRANFIRQVKHIQLPLNSESNRLLEVEGKAVAFAVA